MSTGILILVRSEFQQRLGDTPNLYRSLRLRLSFQYIPEASILVKMPTNAFSVFGKISIPLIRVR
jgi:16S rRNA A1518/A1519 N6-dimethyltransferase RsmA/KsgA/DIM1 with predicted DNA glycosylase/AP lyase activity